MYHYDDPDQMPEPPRHSEPLPSLTLDEACSISRETIDEMLHERHFYYMYAQTPIAEYMYYFLRYMVATSDRDMDPATSPSVYLADLLEIARGVHEQGLLTLVNSCPVLYLAILRIDETLLDDIEDAIDEVDG